MKRRVGWVSAQEEWVFEGVELVFEEGPNRPYFVAPPPAPGKPFIGVCTRVVVSLKDGLPFSATVEDISDDASGSRYSLRDFRPHSKADRIQNWRLFIFNRFDDFRTLWIRRAIQAAEEWNIDGPDDRHRAIDVEYDRVFAAHLMKLPADPTEWDRDHLAAFDAAFDAWFEEQDKQPRMF